MNVNFKFKKTYNFQNAQQYSQLILCWLKMLFASLLVFFSSCFACANSLRDPTIPLNQMPKSEAQVALELAAISGVGGRYFAIINGQRVYEGSIIDGVKIETISDKSVVYSHKGKRHTLNMRISLIH